MQTFVALPTERFGLSLNTTAPTYMLAAVLKAYGLAETECPVTSFGSGLINNTWLVACNDKRYILQRINTHVFKNPLQIAANMDSIGSYLKKTFPDYFFVHAVPTTGNQPMLQQGTENYFRMVPFVEGSHTIDVVNNANQAFEAARQFGKFTRVLRQFDVDSLHITLPHFHDLQLRYQQFTGSLQNALPGRAEKAKDLVDYLKNQKAILDTFKQIQFNPAFKKRVTHHDTKISNVLFDAQGKGLCVIDLDTVMPGYFISDVGDMMRTYLSPVSEEEKDFSKIEVRDDFFYAIAEGYLSEMHDELTEDEKASFVYAGKFMMYMQALRFITDYLNNDIYYGQKYEDHNLVRAGNQAVLLQKLMAKEDLFQQAHKSRQLVFVR